MAADLCDIADAIALLVKDPRACHTVLQTPTPTHDPHPAAPITTTAVVAARRAVERVLQAAVSGPLGFLVRLRARLVRRQQEFREQARGAQPDAGDVWSAPGSGTAPPSSSSGTGTGTAAATAAASGSGAVGSDVAGRADALSAQVAELVRNATSDVDELSGATVMGRAAMRAVLAGCVSEWQARRQGEEGVDSVGGSPASATGGYGVVSPPAFATPAAATGHGHVPRHPVVPKLDLSRVTGTPSPRRPRVRGQQRSSSSTSLVFHHLGLCVVLVCMSVFCYVGGCGVV